MSLKSWIVRQRMTLFMSWEIGSTLYLQHRDNVRCSSQTTITDRSSIFIESFTYCYGVIACCGYLWGGCIPLPVSKPHTNRLRWTSRVVFFHCSESLTRLTMDWISVRHLAQRLGISVTTVCKSWASCGPKRGRIGLKMQTMYIKNMESRTVKLVFGTGCPDHQRRRVMPLLGTSNTSFSK